MSEYTQRDYEAIEAAVMESPRGRWFLSEFARRNRAADTNMLLEAIAKLERSVAEKSPRRAGVGAAETSGSEATEAGGGLTADNLSYFEGDEDLFRARPDVAEADRPAEPAQSLVVVSKERVRNRSIRPDPKGNPKDRIVFIRRASSKEVSIPLADETDDPFAARP